jgi:hypothetical protein
MGGNNAGTGARRFPDPAVKLVPTLRLIFHLRSAR